MAKFVVEAIFPVSFRPEPFLYGRLEGGLTVGDPVEVHKPDGTVRHGRLRGFDMHSRRRDPTRLAIVVSGADCADIAVGDVITSGADRREARTGPDETSPDRGSSAGPHDDCGR
ncbi:hypothetical protein NONO_c32190 [Nocardia nova SH22a]|uniref:Uncharacterized protein n=1 Tax=Nocardia nova SH22a TaxID=1415166 RepID=W5TLA3_9NOCA|nr:hypothetical protein NONO_c32190 [Nocardia nova SH22a]